MLTIDPKLEPRRAARVLAKRLKRAATKGTRADLSDGELATGMERITYLLLTLCMIDELRLAKRLVAALQDWLRESSLQTRADISNRGPRLRMLEELIACAPMLSIPCRDVLVDAIGAKDWGHARRAVRAENLEARETLRRDAPTIVAALGTNTPTRRKVATGVRVGAGVATLCVFALACAHFVADCR